jgi:hypothetical protein
MASPIQILSSPCSMVQKDLDAKQKFMENLTLTQKVPANVLLMNPYETFKSYFDKNQKQLDALNEKYKINNCASDTDTKALNRKKCLQINKNIDDYTNTIAGYMRASLNPMQYTKKETNAGEYDVNVMFADKLREALDVQKKDFIKYGCQAEVEASRQEVVAGIGAEYSAYDKIRIQAESIYERNKRVFFGAVVLVGALALIMTFTSSKSKN